MSEIDLNNLTGIVSELNLNQLRGLEACVKVAIQIRTQSNLSTDSSGMTETNSVAAGEGPSLNDWAEKILSDQDSYSLTLADQGLLAALILSEEYQQESFSSRDINITIKECGRPAVANITSAIGGLKDRSFLIGEDNKNLSLSNEGRKKARALIGVTRRSNAA